MPCCLRTQRSNCDHRLRWRHFTICTHEKQPAQIR